MFFVKFIYRHIVIKLVTIRVLVSSQDKLIYFSTAETIKLSLERLQEFKRMCFASEEKLNSTKLEISFHKKTKCLPLKVKMMKTQTN